ncbi:hypothetical protein Fmac_019359 [Flemingia macrophylla]|uniref:non-specific serine/threonine protein kinase n=1 Tax=Flemingia macrophylla TaxID=520843 RepID=A0ABD1M7K7_9FABA
MRTDEVLFFILLSWVLCSQQCSAGDTLNPGQKITQDSTATTNLVSSEHKFELGFFNLSDRSESRYLGIWYHRLGPKPVVWVANRDSPVLGSNGVFRISEDGNLVVEGALGTQWSSQLEPSSYTNRTVTLLDTGNLVLMDGDGNLLWQSFLNPTDTFLPGMKMDAHLTLTSWKDDVDPARGDFTFKLAPTQNWVVEKQSQLYWAFDRLDVEEEAISHVIFNLLEKNMVVVPISYNISTKTVFESQPYNYSNSRLLMNFSGELQFLKWEEEDSEWDKRWSGPADKCDIHDYCGSFGICNKNNEIRCKCLPGFSPNHDPDEDEEFKIQGCVRKSTTSCVHNKDAMFLNLTNIKVADPGQDFYTETEADCRSLCLSTNECPKSRCEAYSYNASTYGDRASFPCRIWTRPLSTLLEDYHRGLDLSILVKTSDIAPTAKWCEPCGTYVIPYPLSTSPNCGDPKYNKFNCTKSTGQVSFLMPGGISQTVTRIDEDTRMFYIQTNPSYSCSSMYQNDTPNFPFNVADCLQDVGIVKISWLPAPEPPCTKPMDCNNWPNSTCTISSQGTRCLCDSNYKWNPSIMSCTQDRESTRIQESLYECERHVKGLIGLRSLEEKDIEGIEVPCYTFASILAATNNFSDSNKLGRGGYGPVYKGRFPGGQDIAVKRLSSASAQGLREFKNEVILIAKLQHRNLVRLRGYCIEGDEKILLYEYMPNKSLDTFIFDRTRALLLDWPMRFEIIVGIARGMLYLHQDSRLRVIHRDLKTSNILLDEDMNPKISDFGLAKIFGGKETEASTERVVGTYGYMAPEYALDGLFSIKSDIFSFGVILLEILRGERNTGFYESEEISSLLGYAWKLWSENRLLDLMDPSLGGTCKENQFIKCALIGLLCIQDEPGDRPTMSSVLSMLDKETTTLPIPTQPTFFVNKRLFSVSTNEMEVSLQFDSSYEEGR